MESAKLKLIRFDKSDVIATSGGPMLTGVDDGTPDNIIFTGDTSAQGDATLFYNGNEEATLGILKANYDSNKPKNADNKYSWNGSYEWVSWMDGFVKQ